METIKEHTDQLLKRLYEFKKIYQSKIEILSERDWELLEIAVKYHDIGKADPIFQNKIRKNIGEASLNIPHKEHSIYHNYLSVMCIPFKELGLNRDEKKLVTQVVAFHHEREYEPDVEEIKQVYENNFLPYKPEIEKHMGILIDSKLQVSKMNLVQKQKRIQRDDPLYLRYVLLKGLLHRLDHAASAHVPIELGNELNVSEYVHSFLYGKLKSNKNDLQDFAEKQQNAHAVVVAQTGMGKTEAGLLWLGSSKGFFTLPLRVSINAMYERITDVDNIGFTKKSDEYGEEATGLLHSTSLDYMYDKIEGDDKMLEKIHSQSKEYANKLIISTIDQILKFPIYYLGFEKEYATMATSKVIIDELQAYDPKIAALLIHAMKLIDEIGGSFLIMTATLPEYYLKTLQKELEKSRLPLAYGEFIDDSVKRHHIQIRNQSIVDEENIDEIAENGATKKVLVICNTVKRAQEVYDKLSKKQEHVKLLHSRFIKKDRSRLEQEMLDFVKSEETGVWITTQLVEASLDVDFDLLYTEMSTLDSQFQRYGRCNRKGKKAVHQPNIFVLTEDVSGISKGKKAVYHNEIFDRSLELLKQHQGGILLESTKLDMIKHLYSEESLEGTKFKEEFDQTLKELKTRPLYDIKKQEAQELLRDIHQVQAIPKQFLEDPYFISIREKLNHVDSKLEKRKYRKLLEQFSVSVNEWRANQIGLSPVDEIKGLYIIHCEYSSEKGLLDDKEAFID